MQKSGICFIFTIALVTENGFYDFLVYQSKHNRKLKQLFLSDFNKMTINDSVVECLT